MIGKALVPIVRGAGGAGLLRGTASSQPAFHVPKRTWAQVGHIISTPPRIRVSFAEKVIHGSIMMFIWLAPTLYGLSRLKVWRRCYIDD